MTNFSRSVAMLPAVNVRWSLTLPRRRAAIRASAAGLAPSLTKTNQWKV